MGWLGEAVLKRIAKKPARKVLTAGDGDAFRKYFNWQFDSSQSLFNQFPDWDVTGKSVLEIGCGTGGRAAYLAKSGASRVVGIDINEAEIEIAKGLANHLGPEVTSRLEFFSCKESERLEIGKFDVCVLIDCLEHVVSPPSIMRLAKSYLRDGGKCYASCYGYYHHRGSHTGLMPFVNVFFSDETILNVIRSQVSDPAYTPSRFDSDPPIDRWRGIYDLRDRPGEHLNKIRISDMEKLVQHSIFRKSRMTVLGFGCNRGFLKPFDWLRHIPVVREMYHSYVVLDFEN